MREEEKDIARLEAHVENLRESVSDLKANQKWAVLTLLGLLAKAAADFFQRGGGQ